MEQVGYTLSASQEVGKLELEKPGNKFLTGFAGTGKSFLVQHWLEEMDNRLGVHVLASTGAAAVLVQGRTFHSFFGLGLCRGPRKDIIKAAINRKMVFSNLFYAKVIVIDEISMISGYVLGIAEEVARTIRANDEPWGGVKIVMVGDFAQLPPITKAHEDRDWAFLSDTWKRTVPTPIFLKEYLRNNDPEFLEVLNDVRRGIVSRRVKDFLKAHVISPEDLEEFYGTRLYGTRDKTSIHNSLRLQSLPGDMTIVQTTFDGKDDKFRASLVKSMPIPEVLYLKVGALVMTRVNDFNMRYVNGTLARVLEIYPEELILEHLETGQRLHVGKFTFDWHNSAGRSVYSATNYPVILAWACTLHKSQGASITELSVDLRGLWEDGQAYVGLSRSSNPDRLHIEHLAFDGIKADRRVLAFYDEIVSQG